MTEPEEIVRLLRAHEEGDPSAFGRVVPLVYDQLRRLARQQRRQGPQARSLDTTALVHEAYLKLAGSPGLRIRDRGHLMAVTACVTRNPNGTLNTTQAFGPLAAKNLLVLQTQTITPVGASGAVTVAHTGRYGDLSGKTVALEPATGFSFDTPMTSLPH